MDLDTLRTFVECEIDEYVYECPDGMVGLPISAKLIADGLERMRQALVVPYWVSALPLEPKSVDDRQRFAVVTDDRDGYLLAFDPSTDAFVLLFKKANGLLVASHLTGDAVGCFLAQ